MSSDNKEPKRGSIQSFFRSSFKKKKIDHSSSTIDETSHSQESQPNETSSCSSNKASELLLLPSQIPSLSSSSQVPPISSSSISSTTLQPLSIETLPPLSPSLLPSTECSPPTFSPPQSPSPSPSRKIHAASLYKYYIVF